ncbi:DUF6232 family protein [Aristophania vespae]|uniref:DUF6232 family protein n=1 Tax=Aristophania vespae TaxID=2697033 RepID=UPI0023511AF6|nr:DUF6232 family protein [Aristophania vespae]UMM63124.1 hypothetical protein DM15PD_00780 [Aristophania vespae]
MDDSVIYQSEEVMVTKSIVTIGDDTYSIRNINSVNISKEDINKPLSTAFGALVGLVILYFIHDNLRHLSSFLLILGIVIGGVLIKSVLDIMNPQYFLIFSTSNGKTQALSAKSYGRLLPVKKAIEKAFS